MSNLSTTSSKKSLKEYLMSVYPLGVRNLKDVYYSECWDDCNFEQVQEMSDKIIELFKEGDMTYTDAYAMLGYIRKDLEFRSTQIRL